MSLSTKMIVPVAALTIVGGVALTAHTAFAQGSSTGSDTLIQKIAERFGLNRDEVESVFEEFHQERMDERETHFEDRLTRAVTDGEITEEQKQLILAKHEELQSQMESAREQFKDLSPEERRSLMEQHHQELVAWAQENDIDLKVFGPIGMRGGRGEHDGPGFFGGDGPDES